jgi:hypothetical protein
MASDETPNDGAQPPPPTPPPHRPEPREPGFDGFMKRLRARRVSGALAVGLALLTFGGGYLSAKGFEALGHGPATAAHEPSGFGWGLFGKPRDANAPRRGIPKPEGFAVWRSRIDTSQAEPMACVELTRPLDPSKSYADYVLVSPDLGHSPAVSARGSELCVGGVGFSDRRLTLLKGLPAKGGETLAANADVDFVFGEKPPYVGFAGEGVILPREDSDGIGIETVNVDKLHVEVWRVVDRNLVRKSISAPDPTAEGE